MLPGFPLPGFGGLPTHDIAAEQILFTILNIRSQQNRLQALLAQQPIKSNSAFQTLGQNQQDTATPSPQMTQPDLRSPQFNPNKVQFLPPPIELDFMTRFLPFALPSELLLSAVKQEERTVGPVQPLQSDSEPTQTRLEKVDKITVKTEEAEIQIESHKDVESSDSGNRFVPEKVSTSKKIKRTEKCVNTCEHPERKHYAKGLCNNCYHKFGRIGKPELCEHDVLYAKGLCQKCYLMKYNQQKAHMIKKKKRSKGGYKA